MSDKPPGKKRGCFFYGCLCLLIAVILGTAGLFFGVRYAFKSVVAKFTETQPMPLPKSDLPPAEVTQLQSRYSTFKSAVESGQPVPPLVLTSRDLNALISIHPDFKALKDKLYVQIEGDQVKGQVSIPLGQIGLGSLQGRYLNGSAAFKVSLENNALTVKLVSAEVKGQSIPATALAQMQHENLAKDFNREPKNAEILAKFERIEVKDGQIVLTPKARPKAENE